MNPKIMWAVISALSIACTWCGSAIGQIQLVGEHLTNPSPTELVAIGQSSLIYKPVKSDADVLYFTPFFVFENMPDGTLKADVIEPLRSGDPWAVRLTLLVSPNWLLDTLATEVRKWVTGQGTGKYDRYKSIDSKSLIPAEFTYISIREDSDNPVFKPFSRSDITTQQPIYLDAPTSTKKEATELANKLKERRAKPKFEVKYRLYARITVSESQVKVSSISVSQMEGVKSLSGAGDAFRVSVSPTGGTAVVGSDRTVVTRDQKDAFEARVRNEIAAEYVIENPADLTFIDNKLNQCFTIIFKAIDVELKNVGDELKNLSAYNFSPGDITPDKIQRLAVEAKNALQTEDQSKASFGGSASASFLGFGGSASASYSREELKKRMEDKGWKFGADGEAYVPKTLRVYVVDRKALQNAFSIDLDISRRLREMTPFGAEISTDQGFSDKSAELGFKSMTGKNLALAFEQAQKRVDALEKSELKYDYVDVTFSI